MRDKIFEIVEEEFSSLVTRIQSDFVTNFRAKQHNFLLNKRVGHLNVCSHGICK